MCAFYVDAEDAHLCSACAAGANGGNVNRQRQVTDDDGVVPRLQFGRTGCFDACPVGIDGDGMWFVFQFNVHGYALNVP